jgi:hypothetical protein
VRPIGRSRLTALEDHQRYPGCQVMLACEACGWTKGYDVRRVIHRLQQLRAGHSGTPVVAVARQMKRACPHCCERRWTSRLGYPDAVDPLEARRLARLVRS